jgi:hypothetical protein
MTTRVTVAARETAKTTSGDASTAPKPVLGAFSALVVLEDPPPDEEAGLTTVRVISLPVPPLYEIWKVWPPEVNVVPSAKPLKLPVIAPAPVLFMISKD